MKLPLREGYSCDFGIWRSKVNVGEATVSSVNYQTFSEKQICSPHNLSFGTLFRGHVYSRDLSDAIKEISQRIRSSLVPEVANPDGILAFQLALASWLRVLGGDISCGAVRKLSFFRGLLLSFLVFFLLSASFGMR